MLPKQFKKEGGMAKKHNNGTFKKRLFKDLKAIMQKCPENICHQNEDLPYV
jgi:hypothetical protein